MTFGQHRGKFVSAAPTDELAFKIFAGAWKYDFDTMALDGIRDRILRDRRPRLCAEIFPNFAGSNVLEVGPADGYHSAALEFLGANVVAIEGNADAFLRCLILKNALGLQARFELGDLTKAFDSAREIDLVFASGVLYHLLDPIAFLDQAARSAPHLFLWTHFYDEQRVQGVEDERVRFQRSPTLRDYRGKKYRYHERRYALTDLENVGYIGGLNETSNWMPRDDLFTAINAAGYRVLNVYEDNKPSLPAVLVFATRG